MILIITLIYIAIVIGCRYLDRALLKKDEITQTSKMWWFLPILNIILFLVLLCLLIETIKFNSKYIRQFFNQDL